MGRLGWLVWKDVRLFLADRGGVVLTVVTPVVLAVLFSHLFRPPSADASVELLVAREDPGGPARALVDALAADPALDVEEVSRDEAARRLRDGAAAVALVLPEGASAALRPAGLLADASAPFLLHDPSRRYEADMARGAVARATARRLGAALLDPRELRALAAAVRAAAADAGTDPAPVLRVLEAAEALAAAPLPLRPMLERLRDPTDLRLAEVGDTRFAEGFDTWSHNFAGMLVMFLSFMALERARSLLDERARGTSVRLRLTPGPHGGLLAGSALATVALALAVSAVVLGVGVAVFGVQIRGSLVALLAVLVALAVALGGFALLLAGLGRSSTQIATLGTLAVLLMSFIGGATVPSFLMPSWVRAAALATPTHWATQGLAAVTWRGLDAGAVILPVTALLGFGLAFGLLGAARFRWEDPA